MQKIFSAKFSQITVLISSVHICNKVRYKRISGCVSVQFLWPVFALEDYLLPTKVRSCAECRCPYALSRQVERNGCPLREPGLLDQVSYLLVMRWHVGEHIWSDARYIAGLFEQELQAGLAESSSLWSTLQTHPQVANAMKATGRLNPEIVLEGVRRKKTWTLYGTGLLPPFLSIPFLASAFTVSACGSAGSVEWGRVPGPSGFPGNDSEPGRTLPSTLLPRGHHRAVLLHGHSPLSLVEGKSAASEVTLLPPLVASDRCDVFWSTHRLSLSLFLSLSLSFTGTITKCSMCCMLQNGTLMVAVVVRCRSSLGRLIPSPGNHHLEWGVILLSCTPAALSLDASTPSKRKRGYQLTHEQMRVINHPIQTGDVVKVVAFAGQLMERGREGRQREKKGECRLCNESPFKIWKMQIIHRFLGCCCWLGRR